MADVENVTSGTVRGTVVQAGTVGAVHIHSTRPSVPVPFQLPPAPRVFVSRDHELTALERWFDEEHRHPLLVVLSGAGGVGKTSLALRWLHEARDCFPDGQLYVDLGAHVPDGPAAPEDVLELFLRALGVEAREIPLHLPERQALFRSLTTGRSFAVLLDNAASAAQVRALLPTSPSCVVLVTSRWRLSPLGVDGARFIEVDPMDVAASVRLLELVVGERRLVGEADAAAELAELCGGLPIALSVVGARLSSRPRRSLSKEVGELRGGLDALSLDESTSVSAVLDLSYVDLPPRQARLYRLCAWHPGVGFGLEAAAAMADRPVGDVEDDLDDLLEKNLLTELGDDRFRFHDLLRVHAREQPDDERDTAVRRVVQWYLRRSVVADLAVIPGRPRVGPCYRGARSELSRGEGLDWLDRERDNLVHALRAADERDWPDLVWQLCEAMWSLFQRRHYYADWLLAHRLGVRAAQRCGERVAEARLRNQLAVALINLGRTDDAVAELNAVLALAGEDDLGSKATALVQLGRAHRSRGDLENALRHFEHAVGTETALGRVRGIALARQRVGEVLVELGRPQDAIAELTRCTQLMDDPVDLARVRTFLARAHLASGQEAEAASLLETTIVELRDAGSPSHLAEAFALLAEMAHRQGQVERARDHYRSALACYGDPADPDARRIQLRLAELDQDERAADVVPQQPVGEVERELG